MNFKRLILEDKDLSDVDVEKGKMSDILGVPEDETIEDGYDGSAQDAAEELVDAVGEQEAAGMINYAANISGDSFLEDMQDAVKNIDEMNKSNQLRNVVRKLIKQELSEMTTTGAVGGYQTPFAFSDEDDEEREEDIEEFMDKYGYEMAELAKKARDEGLTETERQKADQYIRKVKAMRDGDVAGYKKKSNYLPHNLEENFTEKQLRHWAKEGVPEDVNTVVKSPNGKKMSLEKYLKEAGGQEHTVIRTPKFDLRVYNSENRNLKMEVIDNDALRPVADVTLGKRGGQKLMDAMTFHL